MGTVSRFRRMRLPLVLLSLLIVPALVGAQAPTPTDSASRAAPARAVAPLRGAILPHRRVIAFYGNPLSRRMGVLGEYPADEMLAMLDTEVAAWEAADPSTPVQPALQMITVVARELPGPDGKHRGRMADTLVERVLQWAETRDAIVILDFQVGYSTLQEELPRYERFFRRPNVHVAVDPEFMMRNGGIPGKRMGTMDAADINYAVGYLAGLVRQHSLPPKVLIVHRFTNKGVTNARQIRLDPAVQVVMHMDGFGTPQLKRAAFRSVIQPEPVQFVGWKQFYKARNDDPRTTIEEILALRPRVLYVQYQ
jgi:hypothetical protein